MPSDPQETIKTALGPYIKPREQTAYVRRVLTLYLDSCRGLPSTKRPLSLADCSSEANGRSFEVPIPCIQRDYIRALRANSQARTQYEKIKRTDVAAESHRDVEDEASQATRRLDYLEQHAAVLELQHKRKRLEIIQKHMDLLTQMPAATPEFFSPVTVFADCIPLPVVPRSIVDIFAINSEIHKADIRALASQIEKTAFRAKLHLRQEEQLLEDVKARSTKVARDAGNLAKLRALNASRIDLISWIESKLSKSSEEDEQDGKGGETEGGNLEQPREIKESKQAILEMLGVIKETYGRYITSRKILVAATNTQPQAPTIATPDTTGLTVGKSSSTPPPTSATLLLTPYLESLLACSRNQKDVILQKSYLNSVLAKQTRDTCQVLDHLADESQLLPNHPNASALPVSTGRRGLGDGTDALAECPDVSSRVRPWAVAADAAKLSTLETVAEKIEEGQVALEGSMEALSDIGHLLGWDIRRDNHDSAEIRGEEARAVLRHDSSAGGMSRIPRVGVRVATKKGSEEASKGLWSLIDGKLGLAGPT